MRALLILSLLTGLCACDIPHKKKAKHDDSSWGEPSKTRRAAK